MREFKKETKRTSSAWPSTRPCDAGLRREFCGPFHPQTKNNGNTPQSFVSRSVLFVCPSWWFPVPTAAIVLAIFQYYLRAMKSHEPPHRLPIVLELPRLPMCPPQKYINRGLIIDKPSPPQHLSLIPLLQPLQPVLSDHGSPSRSTTLFLSCLQ